MDNEEEFRLKGDANSFLDTHLNLTQRVEFIIERCKNKTNGIICASDE